MQLINIITTISVIIDDGEQFRSFISRDLAEQ